MIFLQRKLGCFYVHVLLLDFIFRSRFFHILRLIKYANFDGAHFPTYDIEKKRRKKEVKDTFFDLIDAGLSFRNVLTTICGAFRLTPKKRPFIVGGIRYPFISVIQCS